MVMAHQIEMLSWGDAGFYLCTPRGGLGSAAVEAAGTPEQKKNSSKSWMGIKPIFTAMAITEADAGSDNSAIIARAVLDKETNEWILNGEKIFVTAGHKAMIDTEGYTVVWATLDPEAGRAGIRSFVVPANTPGVKVTKKEIKLGIRSSDTVTIVLDDVRVPYDHILGSPEIEKTTKGFKGAMQTFNVTRPLIAASALGDCARRPGGDQTPAGRAGRGAPHGAAAQQDDQYRARYRRYGAHAALLLAADPQSDLDV